MNAPEDLAHLRQPPHSLEAEQSMLGGLLLDNSAWSTAAELVGERDFYLHTHQQIFGAICALVRAGKPADVITVGEQLNDKLEECGGLHYLDALSKSVPSAANIRRYAEIVAERSTLRAIIGIADSAAAQAFRNEPAAATLEALKVALGNLTEARKLGAGRVPLLTLGELRQQAHSVPWLVKHLIPAESIGMLYGGSGTFKSFIAIDAALHVAHGLPWMGRRTKQGAVLYIAAEGGTGLWPRIAAWHRSRRLQWAAAPFHVVPAALNLTTDAWRVVEAAQSKGISPSLLVVDTLSQTYSGEENSANEVAAYFRELAVRFRQLWGCAVLILHHSGHAATERPRGSSAMRANLDFMFGVHRDEKEMLATLTCVKQKDGEAFADATFRVVVHELGTDDDGDVVTSLVARHLTSAEDVQEALEAESKAGRGGKNLLLLKLAQNGAKEGDLRSAFYAECDVGDADARRRAYNRAKAWAVNQRLLDFAEGYVITLNSG